MLLGNETIKPTNQSDYFEAAKAAPQTTGGSLVNGLTAGFITPIAAVNDLKNYFSIGAKQPNGARILLDSIKQDQERPGSSSVGYFLGDMAGFLLNPVNLVGGYGGAAAGKLIGAVATKFLPEAVNITARASFETGGLLAGSMIPTDVVSNYNADTNHLSYGGLAEDLAINMGIGMALPAIPYAYGLIKNRIAAGREAKSAINAADSAFAAKEITPEEHAFATAYAKKAPPEELETLAQNVLRTQGQEVDAATGKVPVTMLEPKDAKAIQDVMGDQLANDLPPELKGAVSDYIVNSKLDKLKGNPKLIDGLKGYVDHVNGKLLTKETTLGNFDKQLDKYIGKQLHADAPLNQRELLGLIKKGEKFGLTIPKQVEDYIAAEKKLISFMSAKKIKMKEVKQLEKFALTQKSQARLMETKGKIQLANSKVAEIEKAHANLKSNMPPLLHPKDELRYLKDALTGKNMSHELKLTRDYHRLIDLTGKWHNAKSVLYRVHNEHAYEKQSAFKQMAENIIKLSESNSGTLAKEESVIDYLKSRVDSKIYKRSADPVPEPTLTNKVPAEGEINIREEVDTLAAKHGNTESVIEAKEAANQFDAFKKAGKILDAYIECENRGLANA